jgi:hypothetical protein
MLYPEASDLTPDSEAPTDIAPLGRAGAKPAHELTAAEEKNATNWAAIEADADFKHLLASKARFIIPATLFFVVTFHPPSTSGSNFMGNRLAGVPISSRSHNFHGVDYAFFFWRQPRLGCQAAPSKSWAAKALTAGHRLNPQVLLIFLILPCGGGVSKSRLLMFWPVAATANNIF